MCDISYEFAKKVQRSLFAYPKSHASTSLQAL